MFQTVYMLVPFLDYRLSGNCDVEVCPSYIFSAAQVELCDSREPCFCPMEDAKVPATYEIDTTAAVEFYGEEGIIIE